MVTITRKAWHLVGTMVQGFSRRHFTGSKVILGEATIDSPMVFREATTRNWEGESLPQVWGIISLAPRVEALSTVMKMTLPGILLLVQIP